MNGIEKEYVNVLDKITNVVLETSHIKKEYTNRDLFNATTIFADVLFNKAYDLGVDENMEFDTKCAMAEKIGNEIRNLVKVYANIDLHNLEEALKIQKK